MILQAKMQANIFPLNWVPEEKVVEGVEVVSDGAELRVHQLALHLVARVGGAAVPANFAHFSLHLT